MKKKKTWTNLKWQRTPPQTNPHQQIPPEQIEGDNEGAAEGGCQRSPGVERQMAVVRQQVRVYVCVEVHSSDARQGEGTPSLGGVRLFFRVTDYYQIPKI